MNSGRSLRKTALFAVAMLAPAAAAFAYPRLSFTPWLPDGWRHSLAPAAYGLCAAAAATVFEFRPRRRIVSCVLVALLSTAAGVLFDAILVLYVAFVTGLVAVGVPPHSFLYGLSSPAGRRAAKVLYRIVRAIVAGALALAAIAAVSLLLPPAGVCPAGGGDITGLPGRFTIITYAFVAPIAALDWMTGSVD